MSIPEMILFDYGHTLVYEPAFDHKSGFRAVLEYCVSNPGSVTPGELGARYAQALDRLISASQQAECDFMDEAVKRLIYESAGLRFDRSLTELEQVYWDAAGPGTPMPGIAALLDSLRTRGIRTAVLSNMNFREENVRKRIDRLIPGHSFEFVLCSCEYATRKPRQDFFSLALKMAGLTPDKAWYCGDNPRCDVIGSFEAGLTPVWYQNELTCPYRRNADRVPVSVPCLRISDWSELDGILAGTSSGSS